YPSPLRAWCPREELRCSMTLPEARADGFGEVALRDEVALVVDVDRQLRQRTRGRSEDDLGVIADVELRLVARAQQAVRLLLVECHGAADVGADLRGCAMAVERRPVACGGLVLLVRSQANQRGDRLRRLLELSALVAELHQALGDDLHGRAERDLGGKNGR